MSRVGGMIEVIAIDGARVALYGDYAVKVLDACDNGRTTAAVLEARGEIDAVEVLAKQGP